MSRLYASSSYCSFTGWKLLLLSLKESEFVLVVGVRGTLLFLCVEMGNFDQALNLGREMKTESAVTAD